MAAPFFPADAKFYYKKKSGKRTLYRLLVDDRVVARTNIPKGILKDIKFYDELIYDRSSEISSINEKLSYFKDILSSYVKYKAKLKDDIARLDVVEIPNDDPRLYYRKRLNSEVVYSYKGYRSREDIKYMCDNLGDKIKFRKTCDKKVMVPDHLIPDIGLFDQDYIFLSKYDQLETISNSIADIKSKITPLREKIAALSAISGKQNKEDIIREYHKLEKEFYLSDVYYQESVKRDQYKWREELRKIEEEQKKREEEQKKREEEQKKREEEERKKTSIKVEGIDYRANPRLFLIERGIKDKKSWFIWLKNNHTDRVGYTPENNKICQEVIDAGRAVGF